MRSQKKLEAKRHDIMLQKSQLLEHIEKIKAQLKELDLIDFSLDQ